MGQFWGMSTIEKTQKGSGVDSGFRYTLRFVSIVNTADVGSNAGIDYNEAVAVMSTVVVIGSFGNSCLTFDDTHTREQAAKRIAEYASAGIAEKKINDIYFIGSSARLLIGN